MNKTLITLGVFIALVSTLLVPSVVIAESDYTNVSGTISSSMSITSPENVAIPNSGNLVNGDNTSDVQTVNIVTNATGWSLTAAESSGGDGYMNKSGGGNLTNPLKIKGGAESNFMPLTSTVMLRNANGTPGTIPIDNIYFQQTVLAADPAGSYSMNVTFTASGGS